MSFSADLTKLPLPQRAGLPRSLLAFSVFLHIFLYTAHTFDYLVKCVLMSLTSPYPISNKRNINLEN